MLNSTTRSRCRECGAPLRLPPLRPAPPPAALSIGAAPAEAETFCAACGVLNSTTRSRCRECGAPLRTLAHPAAAPADAGVYGARLGEDEVVCRGCRRISPADEEWCAGCGRRLRLPVPVAPPPVPTGETRFCPRCRGENPVGATRCSGCGAAFGSKGIVHKPVPAPVPVPPKVEPSIAGLCCPTCGTTMETGEAGLASNYRHLMTWFAGSSWLELFFRRAGEEEREWVLKPSAPTPAARCTRCGGMWIPPHPDRRT